MCVGVSGLRRRVNRVAKTFPARFHLRDFHEPHSAAMRARWVALRARLTRPTPSVYVCFEFPTICFAGGSEREMEQLLTVKQAAALLVCSEAAIRKWIYQRRLHRVKVGRLTRLRQSDIEALVSDGLTR